MLFALQGSCRVGGGAGVRKNRPQKRSKGEKKAFFFLIETVQFSCLKMKQTIIMTRKETQMVKIFLFQIT